MTVQPGRPRLRTSFENARTIGPLYTSGPVVVTPDGKWIMSCISEDVLVTDVSNGIEICRFVGDTQSITSLCITPASTHLLVFTASPSLRIYNIPNSSASIQKQIQPIRIIAHAHDAPVHVCKCDPTSTYLASGSADGVVKVWDITRGFVTHVFKGHGGVVSALAFSFPQDLSLASQDQTMRLITASVDTRVRIFNLSTGASTSSGGKPEAILEGHVSVPRGLDVSSDGRWLVSGGRDSVALLWDLSLQKPSKGKGKGKIFLPTLVNTIPTMERVEAIGQLVDSDMSNNVRFYTGGEKGVIKIWDGRTGDVLFTLGKEHNHSRDQEDERQIIQVIYLQSTSTIISIHADQNIMFYSLTSHALSKQIVGYNDEIVDATFLTSGTSEDNPAAQRDGRLALATNSPLIRVYSSSALDTRLLDGHSEIVLSLDHSHGGIVLASSSKDRSARLWAPNESSNWDYGCVGICEGHTESVGAIAMSRQESGSKLQFMFTGSQDRTIKMWDLSSIPTRFDNDQHNIIRCKSLTTHKAHEKDINSLDVSPNDRLLVSGSQDRTAKIFEITYSTSSGDARGELRLIGTCKGHKRGVWTVRFSRSERVLATGSGDKTVKLWSLDDFSCLKTFEGHTNSVLRVDFLNMGMQLVSAASDGLVKLWNIREESCVATLDNHEDKIWALAISADERTLVSGAADSVVTFWRDCTEEKEEEKEAQRAAVVLKNQDFLNYLALNDHKKAIELALAMDQPGRLLSLFKSIATDHDLDGSITGRTTVDQVIQSLGRPDLAKLLCFARDWNTNAKSSSIAQTILFAILKLRPAEDIINAFGDDTQETILAIQSSGNMGSTSLKDLVDALIPYTERHLARMEKLLQESYVVDYILSEMDDGMFDNEFVNDGMEA